jgi:hypothetical protein
VRSRTNRSSSPAPRHVLAADTVRSWRSVIGATGTCTGTPMSRSRSGRGRGRSRRSRAGSWDAAAWEQLSSIRFSEEGCSEWLVAGARGGAGQAIEPPVWRTGRGGRAPVRARGRSARLPPRAPHGRERPRPGEVVRGNYQRYIEDLKRRKGARRRPAAPGAVQEVGARVVSAPRRCAHTGAVLAT